MSHPIVKICGITNVDDAHACVEYGADWIGINLISSSKRFVNLNVAQEICKAIQGQIQTVAVVADFSDEDLLRIDHALNVNRFQLHGHETTARFQQLEKLLGEGRVMKAARVHAREDVQQALEFGGDVLLIDALVLGELGGTGCRVNLDVIAPALLQRKILVAGGLTKDNVHEPIVRGAFGVDVAGGVESSPGKKDRHKLKSFIDNARIVNS